jgi:hypothetical protein
MPGVAERARGAVAAVTIQPKLAHLCRVAVADEAERALRRIPLAEGRQLPATRQRRAAGANQPTVASSSTGAAA